MSEVENNEGQPVATGEPAATAPSESSNGNSQPTLFAGKYKTAQELEKGYTESTKYVRELTDKVKSLESSVPKAPDEYKFDFSKEKGLENYVPDMESPELKAMLPVFKELNLTQEQASKLIAAHVSHMNTYIETEDQIKAKLGGDAQVILGKLQDYTNKLPLEDQKIISALADSADSIKFLYRHLVGSELPTPGANPGGSAPSTGKSAAELKSEAFQFKKDNEASIGFDSAKQQKYQSMLRAAVEAELKEKKK